jgi:hypothetical protein
MTTSVPIWEKIKTELKTGKIVIAITIVITTLLTMPLFYIPVEEGAKIFVELTIAFIGLCGLLAVYLFTSYDNKIDRLTDKITDREFELEKLQFLQKTVNGVQFKEQRLKFEKERLDNKRKEIIVIKNACYKVVLSTFITLIFALCFSLLFYTTAPCELTVNQRYITILPITLCLSFSLANIFNLILRVGRTSKE